ncbi:class I SAM-dependent methyltransferase [Edaphobacter aggregans]|uniref:class I SAM-dependent methyltransferase n=1 Tax=Edaphobacter aggregans TaxID=570835 RepID=UPI00068B31A0|nr:methyltransferase domain-containing protein [Edaphobacter aggregans]
MEHSPERSNQPLADLSYALDNAAKEASSRFQALAEAFDPATIRHLEDVGVAPGWHCLEVGAGGGSVASWLAARIAPSGRLLITDIDPRFLESLDLPNTQVLRHNIVTDPLPEAAFDLVHARLVLTHIPDRAAALARMATALRPGGWLIDEEIDISLAPDPASFPGEVRSSTFDGMLRVMEQRGVDHRFGRRLFAHLRALGLVHVAAEGMTSVWSAGSPGVAILRANYQQLGEDMIHFGYITAQQFEQDLAALDDPAFMMPSPILWSARGQRP